MINKRLNRIAFSLFLFQRKKRSESEKGLMEKFSIGRLRRTSFSLIKGRTWKVVCFSIIREERRESGAPDSFPFDIPRWTTPHPLFCHGGKRERNNTILSPAAARLPLIRETILIIRAVGYGCISVKAAFPRKIYTRKDKDVITTWPRPRETAPGPP